MILDLRAHLAFAIEHHRAGRLREAEQCYRQILAVDANNAQALHLLGVLAHQVGKHDTAIPLIEEAIQLRGDVADFHANLGEAYRALGRLSEAVSSFERAIHLRPDFAAAHNNLANVLKDRGKLDDAIAHYQRALELNSACAETHFNLGNAFKTQGRLEDAIRHFRRALDINPQHADAHNNLGLALADSDLDLAMACYRRALQVRPTHPAALSNLGLAWHRQGRLEDAMACYHAALNIKPDCAETHLSLGNALHDLRKYAEAIACYQQALRLRPDFAKAQIHIADSRREQGLLDEAFACAQEALALHPGDAKAHLGLAHVLRDQGRLPQAIASLERAVQLEPESALAHSTLAFTLHFSPEHDAKAIYAELRQWNERHAQRLADDILPHENVRAPERRLRIGYVSPDLSMHPVGRFLLPLLEQHDHAAFEVVCYSSVRQPDAITDKCRACADIWRSVTGISDERVAQTIRGDKIDILVDLTMHAADNRLRVFARRPAPVQVTYLAYCGTTGLDAIDYRLADPYLDPPGQDENFYSEKSIRLPETYWCYQPPPETPAVTELPALTARHVTFGCLNNFCKVTEPTLSVWSDILAALPDAYLLLHTKDGRHRERIRDVFSRQKVGPERVDFVDKLSFEEYFQVYQRIDIALDPFPFGGGTTTCEALWMGVPVVTLAGNTAVGRAGVSILSNIGLAELVAKDREEYGKIAVHLAGNLSRLASLRADLRKKMRAAPLMDAPRFARAVESAYRSMWRHWCENVL